MMSPLAVNVPHAMGPVVFMRPEPESTAAAVTLFEAVRLRQAMSSGVAIPPLHVTEVQVTGPVFKLPDWMLLSTTALPPVITPVPAFRDVTLAAANEIVPVVVMPAAPTNRDFRLVSPAERVPLVSMLPADSLFAMVAVLAVRAPETTTGPELLSDVTLALPAVSGPAVVIEVDAERVVKEADLPWRVPPISASPGQMSFVTVATFVLRFPVVTMVSHVRGPVVLMAPDCAFRDPTVEAPDTEDVVADMDCAVSAVHPRVDTVVGPASS